MCIYRRGRHLGCVTTECDDATFVLRNVLGEEGVDILGSNFVHESGNEEEKEFVDD